MKGETLDQCLQDGPHSFVIGIAGWLRAQKGDGPWVLRVSTQTDGESWKPLPNCNSEIKRLANDDAWNGLAMTLAAKVHEAVLERYGPAPVCKLRILCYERGKSNEYEFMYRLERSISALTTGGGGNGIDPTYHYTMVGQLHASVVASAGVARDVVGHLTALVAKQAESMATLATTRVVPTASADLGSSAWSLLGPAALVMAWPMMRQIANDPRGAGFLADMQTTIKRLIRPDAAPLLAPADAERPQLAPATPAPALIGEMPPAPDSGPEGGATPAPASSSMLDIDEMVTRVSGDPMLVKQLTGRIKRDPVLMARIFTELQAPA